MPSLSFRPLNLNDLDSVSEIESQIVGHQRKGFLEKRFAAAVATPGSFVTCAAIDGKELVGYGFARLQEGEFGSAGASAALDIIGVDHGSQGTGVGKAMLAEMVQQLKAKQVATLRTQVDWSAPAMTTFFSSVGFRLAPSQIIERATAPLKRPVTGECSGGCGVPGGERVVVRSLQEDDLAAVVRIDSKLTGRDRSPYFAGKFREVLDESGVRVSLAAEEDGFVVGFIMARVDFGEFGRMEKAAVLDSIGVHPGFKGSGVGHALLSQLLVNLAALQVEAVQTQVSWEDVELQHFLQERGFAPTQLLVLNKEI